MTPVWFDIALGHRPSALGRTLLGASAVCLCRGWVPASGWRLEAGG
jgi:hypothetical protein